MLIEGEQISTVVAEAETGKVFIELLPTQTLDLVIIDIEIPVMRGLEAIRRVQHLTMPKATGNHHVERKVQLLRYGKCRSYGFCLKSSR